MLKFLLEISEFLYPYVYIAHNLSTPTSGKSFGLTVKKKTKLEIWCYHILNVWSKLVF